MKKKIVFILLTVVLAIVSAAAVASAGSLNDNVTWWWGDPAGSSTIVRNPRGISGTVKTSFANEAASAKGLAVTLWLVVFNNPEACNEDGCSMDDFSNPEVKPDVLYATGRVVGRSEKATLRYYRAEGDNSGSIAHLFGLPTNDGEPWGLVDSQKAEIHYVLRSHGPEDPALMPDQITTYGGGCVFNAPFGHDFPAGPADLKLGAGDCQDLQFAIHRP